MEPRQLPVVVALAVTSATVALAFGRVFESSRYVAPVLVAALLPHALGAITRWRAVRGVWAWTVSLGGLAIVALLFTPGAGSPGSFFDRLDSGWRVVEHDVVPIRATDGTILLAVIVVWIVAAVADDLAFRRHASLGALGPGITVLIWVAALGETHRQWLTIGSFGCAAAAFLAVQHPVLLEHRRTRLGQRRLFDAPGSVVAGVLIGVLAVMLGIAAAPALPGGDKPLFDTNGLGRDTGGGDSYRTSIPPLLDVGDKLRRGPEVELFTVRAARPEYWRIVALDEYRSISGGQWTLTAEGQNDVGTGLDGAVTDGALTQHFDIGPLGERWIPAAYEPVRIDRPGVLVVRASSTLVTDAKEVSGLRYTVVSDTPPISITSEQAAKASGAVPEALRRYTELPPDFPLPLVNEAKTITQGLTNPYDKARALRDFFRNGTFTYDLNVDFSGDDEETLVNFLTTRHGFCVQFASAYATMARAVGIPTRIAVGFTRGTLQPDGKYHVTSFDAHAWPEVWLSGIGWTHAFDPTPPSNDPGGSDLPGEPGATTTPPTTQAPQQGQTPVSTLVPGATTPPATAPTSGANGAGGVTVDRAAPKAHSSSVSWLVALLLALILLGVLPIAVVLALKRNRRARRRTNPDPALAITGAWAEAIDDLSDRRVTWPASDTPLEVARRVPRVTGTTTAEPLRALAESYSAVRYGNVSPPAEAARDAWREVEALRRALDESSGMLRRLRARLAPTSLRREPQRALQPVPAGWSDEPRSDATND